MLDIINVMELNVVTFISMLIELSLGWSWYMKLIEVKNLGLYVWVLVVMYLLNKNIYLNRDILTLLSV